MNNVYIDESGINKSSGHTTVACVMVVANQSIDHIVLKIEKDLTIQNLHWKDMSWNVREKVIKKIVTLPLKARVVITNNPSNIARDMPKYI